MKRGEKEVGGVNGGFGWYLWEERLDEIRRVIGMVEFGGLLEWLSLEGYWDG